MSISCKDCSHSKGYTCTLGLWYNPDKLYCYAFNEKIHPFVKKMIKAIKEGKENE
jgi:hypothetical protein